MPENQKKEFDWIEFLASAGKLVGLNPVRIRWKLMAWQDRMRGKQAQLEMKSAAVTRAHKTCPACKSLNNADEKVCAKCGAKLHSRPIEIATRLGRHFDLGLSPESFIVAGFVIAYLIAASKGQTSNWFNLSPRDLVALGGNYPPYTIQGQWWRLWTSVFLHAGLWHIGFNTYALIYIMPFVREVYGSYKGLFVFFIAGVGASLTSFLWSFTKVGFGVSIGGSGAISGLIGLMLVWGHRDGTGFGLEMRNTMARWVLYILIFGFLIGADNAAHIGGWIGGGILALLLPTNLTRPDTNSWVVLGIISGMAAALAVGLIAYLALFKVYY